MTGSLPDHAPLETPSQKLPVQQLAVLAMCRMAEPIVLTSLLPYLPDMLHYVGVPNQSLGQWSGLATAATACGQGLTAFLWGMLADSWGRKPVIIIGLISTMVSTIIFGLSRSLVQLVVIRAILGLMNGNVGVLRTMVAELVTEPALQPRAYSILPMVFTVGCIFGPLIGGVLARPAERFPALFDDRWGVWRTWPFLLPNLMSACFLLSAAVTAAMYLEETLICNSKGDNYLRKIGKYLGHICGGRHMLKNQILEQEEDSERRPLLQTTSANSEERKWKQVFTRESNLVLAVYGLLGFHAMAFDVLLPVTLHMPVQNTGRDFDVQLPWKFAGGLGMDSQKIGLLSACVGASGLPLQIWIFPRVAKRFGSLSCLRAASMLYPALYLVVPYSVLLPVSLQFVGVCALMCIKLAATSFAFPCCTIELTKSASHMRVLGTLNGLATSVTALGRAVGPATVGSLFSIGVERGYMIVPWWTLAVFSLLPLMYLRDMKN